MVHKNIIVKILSAYCAVKILCHKNFCIYSIGIVYTKIAFNSHQKFYFAVQHRLQNHLQEQMQPLILESSLLPLCLMKSQCCAGKTPVLLYRICIHEFNPSYASMHGHARTHTHTHTHTHKDSDI